MLRTASLAALLVLAVGCTDEVRELIDRFLGDDATLDAGDGDAAGDASVVKAATDEVATATTVRTSYLDPEVAAQTAPSSTIPPTSEPPPPSGSAPPSTTPAAVVGDSPAEKSALLLSIYAFQTTGRDGGTMHWSAPDVAAVLSETRGYEGGVELGRLRRRVRLDPRHAGV